MVASVASEPEIDAFSSQSQAVFSESDPEIGVFTSQDVSESDPSSGSSSESQNILHNVVNTEIVDNSNDVDNSNVGAIIVDKDINICEISSADNFEDPNCKNVEKDSVVDSMELDASGPSKKRSLVEDQPKGFLSRIPRFIPHKLIAKPAKIAKTVGRHKLPVVLPTRPGKK